MAKKSMAELIYTAYLTGTEAEFHGGGVTYTFTPEGLKDFITATSVGVSWNDIDDKPSTFPPTIGTTATTAKAGNYAPTWAQVSGKPTAYPFDKVSAVPDAGDETELLTTLNSLLSGLRTAGILA